MSALQKLQLTDSIIVKGLKARAQDRVKIDYTRGTIESETHSEFFPIDIVAQYGLFKGSHHSASQWNAAITAALYQESVNRAYRLISQKQRTEKELRVLIKNTKRYEFTDHMIDSAISRILQLGYLDEASTAKAHVARTNSRLKSSRKLKYELHMRGISKTAADDVLESHSEIEAASELAQKKAQRLKKYDPSIAKIRLYRYLVQQGFPYSLSRQLADQYFSTSPSY